MDPNMMGSAKPVTQWLTHAKTFIILQALETLLGLSLNGFMVIHNLSDWARGKILSISDHLLVAMGITNICFQCSVAGSNCCDFLWEGAYPVHPLCPVLYMLMMFSILCSYWVTGWLCVFYCLKIASFSWPFLLRQKVRIAARLPWLLLGSVLLSLAVSVPLVWSKRSLNLENTTTVLEGFGYHQMNKHFLNAFGYSCPDVMVTVSASVILSSLWEHYRQMKCSLESSSKVSMEAHVAAGRTILCILLLFISFHLLMSLFLADTLVYGSTNFWICLSAISCYPPAHSLILILGNAKLRKTAGRILCPWKEAC